MGAAEDDEEDLNVEELLAAGNNQNLRNSMADYE